MTWPLQILENQLYVSAAHIDIDLAAFVLAGIGTGHAVELEAVG